MIQSHASIWRVTADREGESRVVFDIPLSDLGQVMMLQGKIQTALIVSVEEDNGAGNA